MADHERTETNERWGEKALGSVVEGKQLETKKKKANERRERKMESGVF